MKGLSLKDALHQIIQQNPTATFLVDGTSLRGDIRSYNCPNSANFIFVRDYMAVGIGAPEILSEDFITLRVAALNGPYIGPCTIERYEKEFAAELRELPKYKDSKIFLLQFDCYVSQIWQLTMQAYIEQIGFADSIKRVCFNDAGANFSVSQVDTIAIEGSHDAYCKLVCEHKSVNLKKYFITEEAVRCYLDINSETGALRDYICETSSQFNNPFHAAGQFLSDFQAWGLGDGEFLTIALQTLSRDANYKKTLQKWGKVIFEKTGYKMEEL